MAVLAVSARLAHEPALGLYGPCKGLPIGYLRVAHPAFHLELPRYPVHDYFKVKLAHAGYYGLAGLAVNIGLEGWVLLGELLQRLLQLFLPRLGLGLY